MKKTFFIAGIVALMLTLGVNAQDSTKPVQTQPTQDSMLNPAQTQTQTQTTTEQQKATTTQQTSAAVQEQKKYGNPTVDSILSKYTLAPMPSQLTTEQIFPVIGQYQSSTSADQKLTITLDDQNKGFAWVDGLPQGKAKAILKKSPATYKIPAQKTVDGKDIPEGTLIYDKDSKIITVMLGRPFNDQDPASVFANPAPTDQTAMTNDQTANDQSNMKVTKSKTMNHKTKTKEVKKVVEPAPWVFTGTKVEQVTATNQ